MALQDAYLKASEGTKRLLETIRPDLKQGTKMQDSNKWGKKGKLSKPAVQMLAQFYKSL